MAIACAALHGTFVFLLFGNQWSWIYYSNVLFVGTAVALNGLPRRLGGMLESSSRSPLSWPRLTGSGEATRGLWIFTQRHVDTAGLYAAPDEAAAWGQVRELGQQNPGRVFVLTRMGCPHLLAREAGRPAFVVPHSSHCTARRDEPYPRTNPSAEWIVSPAWHDNDLMTWPELTEVLKPFREEGSTPFFKMYRRVK